MRRLSAAMGFLSRLPLGGNATPRDLSRSTPFFPLVGLILGLLLSISYLTISYIFPSHLDKFLVLVLDLGLVGAFHLDGLADCADAFYAGRKRSDIFRIMKDPHLGVMAVLALVSILGLKAAAWIALSAETLVRALPGVAILGRSLLSLFLASPPARPGSLAAAFHAGAKSPSSRLAAWTGLLLPLPLLLGSRGLAAAVAGAALAALFVGYARRKLGGITGDVCGAALVLGETVAWLVLASR